MCGIAGWYRRDGRPVPASIIKALCDTIIHRGPDDSGILTEGDFGFGMRRLSILDVHGGHQPMETPDRRYAIVFNGEIFNHHELRPLLSAGGYEFTTHCDTETILAGFARWGNDVWAKLEGMFAVAVWDRQRRSLTLARDPLGIKPLYFSEQGGGISFASELKALRVLPNHRFDVDDRSVDDFFRFGHVRRPRSIFRQVASLDPGHFLVIPESGARSIGRYWKPKIQSAPRMSEGDWVEQMRDVLSQTTKRHMQADVPVAAFLSGGIDSSAILAAMTMANGNPIKAFTIGHPGAKIDETDAARRIAAHLGCEHIVAPLDMAEATDRLPQILACYDEPFADMAAIPTWFASKLASQSVKVVLCGEGGDELFAGYKRHRNARGVEQLRPIIGRGGILSAMANALPVSRSSRINSLRQHAQRFGEFAGLPDGYQQFFAATEITSRTLRRRLYTREFWERQHGKQSYAALEEEYFPQPDDRSTSALNQFLLADLTLNMPSAMLPRLDRASMAHSVEARVPFLSHKLVEWALTVPQGLKLRGGTGKYILREAVKPWLPRDIAKRPKQGFQIPMADWLRAGFGTFARESWNASDLAHEGYLDGRAVDQLFQEHQAGAADHSRILYAITAFAIWSRQEQLGSSARVEYHVN